MPRTFVRRPGERVPRRISRAKVYVPTWVDPYVWIQGSVPEKMVMAEFVRRGIYFEHTPQTNPLPWPEWAFVDGQNPRNWEADFLLPQYKIWLEVQGSHWHTLPGAVETDALRMVYIEAVGWKPIFWWEEDIRARLQDLMNGVPEFNVINPEVERVARRVERLTKGLPFFEGGDGIDHLAGLRSALRGRARPPQGIIVRRRSGGIRRPK